MQVAQTEVPTAVQQQAKQQEVLQVPKEASLAEVQKALAIAEAAADFSAVKI